MCKCVGIIIEVLVHDQVPRLWLVGFLKCPVFDELLNECVIDEPVRFGNQIVVVRQTKRVDKAVVVSGLLGRVGQNF